MSTGLSYLISDWYGGIMVAAVVNGSAGVPRCANERKKSTREHERGRKKREEERGARALSQFRKRWRKRRRGEEAIERYGETRDTRRKHKDDEKEEE